MYKKDISGARYGRLIALYPTDKRKRGNVVWMCKCECGNMFETTVAQLNASQTLSCGCMRREKAIVNARKGDNRREHGLSGSKIYMVWQEMKQRCKNQKRVGYKNYGGRGISVYSPWVNDFTAFYNYVSKLPHFQEEGRSLDRINNDGNYEPNNLRWATRSEQAKNRRR